MAQQSELERLRELIQQQTTISPRETCPTGEDCVVYVVTPKDGTPTTQTGKRQHEEEASRRRLVAGRQGAAYGTPSKLMGDNDFLKTETKVGCLSL